MRNIVYAELRTFLRVKALQMATKRKHVTLTLSEKLKIIDFRGSGCSLARISAEWNRIESLFIKTDYSNCS